MSIELALSDEVKKYINIALRIERELSAGQRSDDDHRLDRIVEIAKMIQLEAIREE